MSVVGSPVTAKVEQVISAADKAESNGSARLEFRPVTTKALLPISRTNDATSRSVPGPKRILVAVANSKRMSERGQSHQPESSGKRLWYLVLRRGAAIMSATVSRHFA